MKTIANGGN